MSGSKNTSRVPKKKKSEKYLKNIMGVHLNPHEKKFSPLTVFQYRKTQNPENRKRGGGVGYCFTKFQELRTWPKKNLKNPISTSRVPKKKI